MLRTWPPKRHRAGMRPSTPHGQTRTARQASRPDPPRWRYTRIAIQIPQCPGAPLLRAYPITPTPISARNGAHFRGKPSSLLPCFVFGQPRSMLQSIGPPRTVPSLTHQRQSSQEAARLIIYTPEPLCNFHLLFTMNPCTSFACSGIYTRTR